MVSSFLSFFQDANCQKKTHRIRFKILTYQLAFPYHLILGVWLTANLDIYCEFAFLVITETVFKSTFAFKLKIILNSRNLFSNKK